MCTPEGPQAPGSMFWYSGAPGMTAEETAALPRYGLDDVLGGFAGLNAARQLREQAMQEWIDANPKRYQEGLRIQEGKGPSPRQEAQAPRRGGQAAAGSGGGAAGGGGGGASSQDTLLTSGMDPSMLDLSRQSLLGL